MSEATSLLQLLQEAAQQRALAEHSLRETPSPQPRGKLGWPGAEAEAGLSAHELIQQLIQGVSSTTSMGPQGGSAPGAAMTAAAPAPPLKSRASTPRRVSHDTQSGEAGDQDDARHGTAQQIDAGAATQDARWDAQRVGRGGSTWDCPGSVRRALTRPLINCRQAGTPSRHPLGAHT